MFTRRGSGVVEEMLTYVNARYLGSSMNVNVDIFLKVVAKIVILFL